MYNQQERQDNMQSLYDSGLITDDDIGRFSDVKDIQQLAIDAVTATKAIFPIYLLTRISTKTGSVSKETDQVLSLYTQLATEVAKRKSRQVCIKLSVYEHDISHFYKYTVPNTFEILAHPCTDYNSKTACSNVVSKIRNFCLDDNDNTCHAMRHYTTDTNWLYFMEDDMLFQRVVKYNSKGWPSVSTCETWQDLLIAFAIWQYKTVCVEDAIVNNLLNDDDVPMTNVGISGFPGYDSACADLLVDVQRSVWQDDSCSTTEAYIRFNTTRLANCFLLNTDVMRSKNLRYETLYDCWDGMDMNLQFAAIANANSIAIDYPICTTTNRPMVSDASNVTYSTNKLNNYAAQMYYKWGNIIKFRTWKDSNGKVYAINSKLPDDYTFLVEDVTNDGESNFTPTYDYKVISDLQALIKDDSLLDNFVDTYVVN